MRSPLLFTTVVLATFLTQYASDIYAPSLPAIADSLHTSIHLVQSTMAIYMLGVAITQLFYGPLSEGIGRKKPMVIGLSIMLMGSVICWWAPSIEVLFLGRLIQGCGAGACAALWRTIFRDIATGSDLARYGSYLTMLSTFIIPSASAIGGYLQTYFDWRASFLLMSVYLSIHLSIVLFGFTETNAAHHPDKLKFSYLKHNFYKLLSSRIFMGTSLSNFLSYGGLFSWLTVSPILFIEVLGLSPVTFGWITCIGGGIAYALSGWMNGKLVNRLGMGTMMRIGWSCMIFSSLFLGISYITIGLHSWNIVVPMMLFYFGSSLIWPNAFATAFTPFGEIAGITGALYGFMQLSGAAVIGSITSYLPDNTPLPLAMVTLLASLLAWYWYEQKVRT